MIDQNSQFFATLTDIGAAKQANANALGIPWKITQMGVGDANGNDPVPSSAQKGLINERRRAPLNQLKVDPSNASIIIAEQVIPAEVGGFWIREIGLYDEGNDLVAVANCAPSFKPLLTQGSGRTQVVRVNLIVSNTSNVELKIDPSVVLATRSYVDQRFLDLLATEQEASAGENNLHLMTPLRVKQSLRKLKGIQRYTSSGTFTVPAGVTTIWASGCAGGGGGGGGAGGDNTFYGGGGGGGGAGQSILRVPIPVVAGANLTITLGAGGIGGTMSVAGGGNGGSGGNSMILGATSGLLELTGGGGGYGSVPVSSTYSGGGGAGTGYPAGSYGNDAGQVTASGSGGMGASSPFGGGGGCGRPSTAHGVAGSDSFGYGSGGGGGGGHYSTNTGGPFNGGAGGAGSQGLIILEW